jgi:hypothetical protein
MRPSRFLPAALVLLVATVSARAMMVYIPLPATIAQSDLVAIGEVTERVGDAERDFTFPGSEGVSKQYLRTVKVRLTRTLHSPGGAKAGDVINVVMLARKPEPPPAPGQVRMVVSDGPVYLGLDKGQSGAMILRLVPGGQGEYYLQGGGDNWVPAGQDERLARLESVARVDGWAWGIAVRGLQIAIVPDRATILLPAVAGPNAQVQIGYVVVLRNTGDAAVAVNLYSDDRFLRIRHQTPDGKTADWPLYDYLKKQNAPTVRDPKRHEAVVPAGGMITIARYGLAPYGDHEMRQDLAVGRHSLTVRYASLVEREAVGGAPLWAGELSSGAAEFTVVPAP